MSALLSVPILTYHSISDAAGPTSISRATFRAQMQTVADLAIDVVGLDWISQWIGDGAPPVRRTLAITFDDAFQDFADEAHPILQRLGFSACVFAPTALVGGAEKWRGANAPPRPLMKWETIRGLSNAGVDFGSHARTHRDLTTLSVRELDAELSESRGELEDALGRPARYFAPPYGRSNDAVRNAIAKHYALSVGVRFNEATRDSPRFDLPRIEMHYYRDISRWRAFLEGEGGVYFQSRRLARGLRAAFQAARG